MTQNDDWQQSLVSAIGASLRALRGRDSAQEVSDRTAFLGHRIGRSVISDIELGRRKYVAVHELMMISWALGVSPLTLLSYSGLPDGSIAPVPGQRVSWDRFMGWWSGQQTGDRTPIGSMAAQAADRLVRLVQRVHAVNRALSDSSGDSGTRSALTRRLVELDEDIEALTKSPSTAPQRAFSAMREHLDTAFIGQQRAKLRIAELFLTEGEAPPSCVVLEGPPGTGKHAAAEFLALMACDSPTSTRLSVMELHSAHRSGDLFETLRNITRNHRTTIVSGLDQILPSSVERGRDPREVLITVAHVAGRLPENHRMVFISNSSDKTNDIRKALEPLGLECPFAQRVHFEPLTPKDVAVSVLSCLRREKAIIGDDVLTGLVEELESVLVHEPPNLLIESNRGSVPVGDTSFAPFVANHSIHGRDERLNTMRSQGRRATGRTQKVSLEDIRFGISRFRSLLDHQETRAQS